MSVDAFFLAPARAELSYLVRLCQDMGIDIPEVHRLEDIRLWPEDPAIAEAIEAAIDE